ncbi:Sodium/potassium-transporting ATPase subunit alpha-A [Neolecta irregularis DAH-3]|uniref:Sodium/potassium-transporting ATPase subunit alpha-A n=1 Tax=Neolecta irregularis (strain DAH-3) TaxID=1198029 RepID=A0A1U7LPI1_NEOID|nr:Sodium/potassium-transporting ATPase subunit alpha-A [Neolecta irregularis DAH-3]|eukprot:OLL24431.1 Sodium/potassium-transporting ATPase subunit alpha-A [Neolecta irregularis DAH-3]
MKDPEKSFPRAITFDRVQSNSVQFETNLVRRISSVSTFATTRSEDGFAISERASFRRRSIEPTTTLPIGFRTVSIGIHETNEREERGHKSEKKGVVGALSDLDFHLVSIQELSTRFSTSIQQGLSPEQVARKLTLEGPNVLSPPPSRVFQKLFGYVFGGFGSILIIACILVFISWKPLGDPPASANLALAIVLLVVEIVQASFNAWQDWSTSQVMASISGMLPSDTIVVRDGTETKVPSRDLVPGDIVLLKMGVKVPADIRLSEICGEVKFDRSVLTGEADPVSGTRNYTDKNFLETGNVALQGTHCVGGSATGIVIQTGDRTVFGRIAKLSSSDKRGMTTLQREIFRFVSIIVTLALLTCVLVLIIWGSWLRRSHPTWITTSILIVDVVSVLVAFVPEGLPIAVTTTLTIIARTMKKSMVLCKSLSVVETLGAVNVLCSDKTGTLTKNQMSVTTACIFVQETTPREAHENIILHRASPTNPGSALSQLHAVASLCCAATFDATTVNFPLAQRKINGDATDCAVLRFAEELGKVDEMHAAWKKVYEIPFNSKNKFMLRIVKPFKSSDSISEGVISASERASFDGSQGSILFIKGAPDILIKRCSSVLLPNDEVVPLTEERITTLSDIQLGWASNGLRVLLLARRILKETDISPDLEVGGTAYADAVLNLAFQDLTVVGMVGIVDPLKDDIPEVVATCRSAGIRFFMVTGDFAVTAASIACQSGIITVDPKSIHNLSHLNRGIEEKVEITPYSREAHLPPVAIVLSGSDLITLNDYQWEQLCAYEEIVFARTTPDQKLRIVKEFQKRECVVGMTGDGVNDAPSLKAADIGVAIGNGSEVAIEAADIVLLDSFSAIITAIEYGRLAFDNLQKTVIYLLPAGIEFVCGTANDSLGAFSELFPVLFSVLFGLPQILSSFLMIVICCLTDAVGAMTMVFEKPESDLLTRPPRNIHKDRLANKRLLFQAVGFIGLIECTCSMAMAFWYMQRNGVPFGAMWLQFGNYPDGITNDRVNAVVATASSIYFSNLVIMQFFNLLATRTRRLSILQQPPIFNKRTQNRWIFLAMLFALCVVFFFCYIPTFQNVIGSTKIPVEHFFLPVGFGMGLLCIDEARKLAVRTWPEGFLARIAW